MKKTKEKPSKVSTALEMSHEAEESLLDQAYILSRLAKAFYITGNNIMGDELYGIYEKINKASELVGKSTNMFITGACEASSEASNNMFLGVLAGATITSEDEYEQEAIRDLAKGMVNND